jgi:hypothetical protein
VGTEASILKAGARFVNLRRLILRAIAFQISLRATFVILSAAKDLRLLFLLCAEGWKSQEAHIARNSPKGNRSHSWNGVPPKAMKKHPRILPVGQR